MNWLRYIIVAAAAGGLAGGMVMFLFLGPRAPAGGGDDAAAAIERHLAQLRRDAAKLPAVTHEDPESKNTVELRKQMEQLRGDLARLETALQDMRLQQPATQGTVLSFDEATEEEEHARGIGNDEAEQQARLERNRERLRQHFADIETAFRAEAVDRAWSEAVGTKLHDAFSDDEELSKVTLSNVECRANRCRLEVWYDDDTEMDDAVSALNSAMVGETPRMAMSLEEEPGLEGGTAIIYLARTGQRVAPQE